MISNTRKIKSKKSLLTISNLHFTFCQWRSHWGGKGGGQSATPDSKKFAKNREKEEKIRKNRGKRGKTGKKRQKSGSFFQFAPPDR